MANRRLSDEERLNHKRASQRAYLKTEKGKATSKKARRVWRSTKEGHDWLYQDRIIIVELNICHKEDESGLMRNVS